MFAQGNLWYGPGSYSDLLTTAKPMQYANKESSPLSQQASLRKIYQIGIRRVPYGTLKADEVNMYKWDPNYGYRQIKDQPTTKFWNK